MTWVNSVTNSSEFPVLLISQYEGRLKILLPGEAFMLMSFGWELLGEYKGYYFRPLEPTKDTIRVWEQKDSEGVEGAAIWGYAIALEEWGLEGLSTIQLAEVRDILPGLQERRFRISCDVRELNFVLTDDGVTVTHKDAKTIKW